MEERKQVLPLFKEYDSTLMRYSDSDQLQANQYKSIIESRMGQALYDKKFKSLDAAVQGPLNANVPVQNVKEDININGNKINVYKQFWQYKQPGYSIFTNWESASLAATKEDISVKDLALHGQIKDSSLVLSNMNYVRNNMTNYGKEYLTTTNMLDSEAFLNGIGYESANSSPFRQGQQNEVQQIIHGNFKNAEDGDLYSRQVSELRVDLPSNYANTSMSSWMYINPAFIIPESSIKILHESLKFGIFDLTSIKLTGISCLTPSFGVTPQGYEHPVDVLNDDGNFPPLENPDYYNRNKYHYKKHGIGENMYCSANANYIAMPKNHCKTVKGLDTSFQVSVGNNSLSLGVVMSPNLKNFIRNELYKFNLNQIIMHIYQNRPYNLDSNSMQYINHHINKNMHKYNQYMNLDESSKYSFVYKQQKEFVKEFQIYPEVEIFINKLNIFKFGGKNHNNPNIQGKVRCDDISSEDIPIGGEGCFLLLPTMLSEDVFSVRTEIPSDYAEVSSVKNIHDNPNNCTVSPNNYQLNATNCAFRDHSGKWQQVHSPNGPNGPNGPNFVPQMFMQNNDEIYNSVNNFAGRNPYNAPTTF